MQRSPHRINQERKRKANKASKARSNHDKLTAARKDMANFIANRRRKISLGDLMNNKAGA